MRAVATSIDPAEELPPISARYLLLTFVPCYVEGNDIWLERLWHLDFVEHLTYLRRLTLAAPVYARSEGPPDLVRVDVPANVSLSIVPLPKTESMSSAIARAPITARRLWRAIDRADIVHSGVAGWPFPVGWIGNTIALLKRRKLVIVVESAPWRLDGKEPRIRDRVRAVTTEALAHFFVRRADLDLVTQPAYQRSLGAPEARCFVTPAAWINDEDIATLAQGRMAWATKRHEPVRLLFAARLIPEKGTDVLLEAVASLDRRGVPARIDVIGAGPRRDAFAQQKLRHVELRLRDPVPYGPFFFEVLRDYHAVLVPNLGDEQPRIVFDAHAQAVAVIASDTDGIVPYVRQDETGWLFRRGSTNELARAIERATRSCVELERMGMRALREAPRFTHRSMHRTRRRILHDVLGV